ncbi:helix-turn-helix domain-containing protein [Pseudobacteroides sp.]
MNATEFAKLIGVSRATLYRYINEYEETSAIKNK